MSDIQTLPQAPGQVEPLIPQSGYRRPSPDYGMIQQFAQSAYTGAFQNNLSVSVIDSARYMGQRLTDRAAGVPSLTQTQWSEMYGEDTPNMKYVPGVTLNEATLRAADAANRAQSAARNQSYRYPITSLAGVLLGSALGDPYGSAVSLLIPEAKIASTISAAAKARAAAASAWASAALRSVPAANRAMTAQVVAKNLSKLGTAGVGFGDVARGVFVDTASAAKAGVESTIITEGSTWALDNGFLGREYQTTDLLYGTLIAGGFSAGVRMLARTAGGRKAVAMDMQRYAGQQILRDVAGDLPPEGRAAMRALDELAEKDARGTTDSPDVPGTVRPEFEEVKGFYRMLGYEVRLHEPDSPSARSLDGGMRYGWHDTHEPGVVHLVAHEGVQGSFDKSEIGYTVNHELMHGYLTRAAILKVIDPKAPDLFQSLVTTVTGMSGFSKTYADLQSRFSGSRLLEEAVASHTEQVIAHPEFWRQLPRQAATALVGTLSTIRKALRNLLGMADAGHERESLRKVIGTIDQAWHTAIQAGYDVEAIAKTTEAAEVRAKSQYDAMAAYDPERLPADRLPPQPQPNDHILERQSQDQVAAGQYTQLQDDAAKFSKWVTHDAAHRKQWVDTAIAELAVHKDKIPGTAFGHVQTLADEVQAVTEMLSTGEVAPENLRGIQWFDKSEYDAYMHQLEYYKNNPQECAGRTPAQKAAEHRSIHWNARVIQGIRHCQATLKAQNLINLGSDLDNRLSHYSFSLSGILNSGVTKSGTPNIGEAVNPRRIAMLSAVMNPIHNLIDKHGLSVSWTTGELQARMIDHDMGNVAGAALTPQEIEVYTAFRAASDIALSMHNQAGDVMRKLPGRMIATVHNADKIIPRKQEWFDFCMSNLDWDAVSRAIFPGRNQPLGGPEMTKFLNECFDSVTNTGFDMHDPKAWQTFRLDYTPPNPKEMSRVMFWKDGTSTVMYDHKFGSGDFGAATFSQLNKQLEYGFLRREFGDFEDYTKVVYPLIDFAADQSTGLTSVFPPAQVAKASFEMLTMLDDPVSVGTARVGSFFRHVTSAAVLGKMAISSACDMAGSASMLRYLGGNGKLFPLINDTIKRMAGDKTGREFLKAQSAMYDSLMQNYTKLGMRDGGANSMAKRMSSAMFKWSLMNRFNDALRMTYADHLSSLLGTMADRVRIGDTLPPQFLHALELYGITPEDFISMSKHADEIDGLEGVRLAPSMVKDAGLARKLHTYFTDTSNYASTVPSITDEGLLRFRTRAGTAAGEAARVTTQYLGMPMAMMTKMRSRLYYGYGEQGTGLLSMNLTRSLPAKTETAMFAGQLLFMGWVSTVIKDTLAGREPLHFMQQEQWTMDNWKRIVGSSGILGMAGVAEERVGTYGIFGTFPSYVLKSLDMMDDAQPQRSLFLQLEGMAPFRTLPVIGEPLYMLSASMMSETAARDLELRERGRLMNGQSQLLDYTLAPEPTK